MANNRELSQFGNFISVNDTSENIGISTDVIISGVLTATRYYGDGSQLTGIATIGGGTTLGITTISELNVTGITSLTSLIVSGVSTFGNIVLDPVGIITAASGIVTYYGDGSNLTGVISGVGISTEGGSVGTGATVLDFRGSGISTVTVGSGIGTIFIQGGGGSVSISSIAPTSPSNGDLWYNIIYGRTFVWYDEAILGIGSTAVWVDAAPFNVGFITAIYGGVAFSDGTASTPSWYFSDNTTTGVFSPVDGELTFVSTGSSILNINSGGINVTGIVTAVDFDSLSDINYKENIETIDGALDKVSNIRGVKFDWKESGQKSYGVIAQELENILPELVHGENPRVVNYNGIIGVLIEAIKELRDEVHQLKSEINK